MRIFAMLRVCFMPSRFFEFISRYVSADFRQTFDAAFLPMADARRRLRAAFF